MLALSLPEFPVICSALWPIKRLNVWTPNVFLWDPYFPHIRNVDSHLHFCHNEEVDQIMTRRNLDTVNGIIAIGLARFSGRSWYGHYVLGLLRRSVWIAITNSPLISPLISLYIGFFTVYWLSTSLQFPCFHTELWYSGLMTIGPWKLLKLAPRFAFVSPYQLQRTPHHPSKLL